MFRQVWIDFGSALDIWVSASSSWTLDGFSFQFLNFEYIDLGFWFLGVKYIDEFQSERIEAFFLKKKSNFFKFFSSIFGFQFLGVEYIGSAFGSWVFQLSVFGRLILVQLSVPGVKYIGFDFQFLDVCYWFRLSVLGHLLLVSAFGSWHLFWLSLSVLIYRFRLSVLGHLIYRFRLFVLGCLICSSYAFDLKLSVVNCNILGLWIGNGCDISLGFGSVSAVISLGIEMFQLRYLWIWKSAPESQ
ncbi:unnamed protein product [Rhizophagus irregularis]|nr:unnamed protein product [Rhizophagus irregularis]